MDDALPKPGAYRAVFTPVGVPAVELKAAHGLRQRRSVMTAHTQGEIAFADDVHTATSGDGRQFVVLSGLLVRPQTDAPAQAALAAYQRHGPDFARHLSGNFSLILVDEAAGQILVATDRINSTKVLYSRLQETLVVSNNGDIHPFSGPLDQRAIAFFLASGFIPTDRTFFEGVRLLEGGTVAEVEGNQLRRERYWRYEKRPANSSASAANLKRDFADLLVEAVRLRLTPGAPVYVSLSAGGDSRAILGILGERLRVPDVRCFSYTLGRLRADSDEALARQMAALYGYEHRLIPSFDGDLLKTLERNAHWGSGMTGVCDEAAVWAALAPEAAQAGQPKPILFTGETANARADYHLTSVEDVIAAAKLKDFSVLPWLAPFVGAGKFALLDSLAQDAIAENVARCPPTDTLIAMRQVLWLQQRDRLFLGWREYYPGRAFTIGLPLMDDAVIDFVLQLPDDMHRGRRLYEETMAEMFPTLFAIPFARSSSYAHYWPNALRSHTRPLTQLLRDVPSPLDDVIEPGALMRAMDLNNAWRNRQQSLLTSVLKKSYRFLKRRRLHESRLTSASNLMSRPVEPHVLLKRALVLRATLTAARARGPLSLAGG